ncbi:MAG: prolyl-tRNA synthetase associated domain-containing protein [Gemmatimonadaceae bacterium]
MPIDTPYTDATLCALLDAHQIPYERADHPPVFTCDEAHRLVPESLGGEQTKNLFLRDGKGRRHWLVVTSCAKAVDLKALAPRIGADHLSLGSPERLLKYLGLTPGAVTLFGIANDPTHDVTLFIDRDVWNTERWRCHPMVNSATLVITRGDAERFAQLTGHKVHLVEVPVRAT